MMIATEESIGRVGYLVMETEFGTDRVRDRTHQTAIGEKNGKRKSK